MDVNFDDLFLRYKHEGQPTWTREKETQVLEPYNYLLSIPGKDIRSTLIHAFNVWLKLDHDSLDIVLKAVEMLHTASLLIDDVEDCSELRRGLQAAHLKFGSASTINAANYIYFSAMSLIRSTGNPDVVRIFEEEILNLHRGQGLELFWRDRCGLQSDFDCPTESDYIAMVNDKTGGLLRMAIRLMQALSPTLPLSHDSDFTGTVATGMRDSASTRDYVPLANMVGILFQIRDDYMNLASLQYCKEKGFCEDLTEGKFSYPVIHGILKSDTLSARLKEILQLKTSDVGTKIEACQILEKLGSLEYTIQSVHKLDALCREEIRANGGNEALSKIMDVLLIRGDESELGATIAFAKSFLLHPGS